MANTLYDLLPREDRITADLLLGRFLEYVAARSLTLYPAQEEAVLELLDGKNVILNTPTGSGKSLVSMALDFFLPAGEQWNGNRLPAVVRPCYGHCREDQ